MNANTPRNAETIAIASLDTRYGPAVAAASNRGLCLLLLAGDLDSAKKELRRSRPGAVLAVGEDGRAKQLALAALNGSPVEVDLRGTGFQLSVWEALRKIPAGTTASYAEVARMAGRPSAVRAAAAACAANRIAVAVPCHRVVRSDGGLSGYRWGPSLKQAILDAESRR